MATDQAASLREGFRDLMTWLTGTSLLGDGALWWIAVYAFAVGRGGFAAGGRHASEPAFDGRPVGRRDRPGAGPGRPAGLDLRRGAGRGRSCSGREAKWPATCCCWPPCWFTPDTSSSTPKGSCRVASRNGAEPKTRKRNACRQGRSPRSPAGRAVDEDRPAARHAAAGVYQRPRRPAGRQSAAVSAAASAAIPRPANHKLTKAERKALKERLLRERMERQGRG